MLLFVFFLSGACALVYQVVWVRQLALIFGALPRPLGAPIHQDFAQVPDCDVYGGHKINLAVADIWHAILAQLEYLSSHSSPPRIIPGRMEPSS